MNTVVFDAIDLEERVRIYKECGVDAAVVYNELTSMGYTADSFRYNPQSYEWFKKIENKCRNSFPEDEFGGTYHD